MQIDLTCPHCGMSLADQASEGFILNGETYCCAGCAEGTGCTCKISRAASLQPEIKKAPARQPHRGDRLPDGRKIARSQSEERPSTREQARGRSELRGKLNKRVNQNGGVDRVSKTGSKGK
ncbi:MAG: hypothetical protein M3Y82_11535 [Verrucomicrobiota bacterium]|nr:hypothetical protein [Verrucomicrobiota bacterium]